MESVNVENFYVEKFFNLGEIYLELNTFHNFPQSFPHK